MRRFLPFFLLASSLVLAGDVGLPPGVKDTQPPGDVPPTPDEAVRRFKMPPGFTVNLFAGEPHVCQPISMAWDDRGRLWVAECFSYPAWMKDSPKDKDRILVFEDTDGDGKFDKRTVFWDRANNLTSIAVGYGGVWALCAPHLLFFPDKDGDDRPDTDKPQVILDGWSTETRHNLVNGLTWGPDGWLYGCHGIVAESKPGVPGTPDDKRPRINCGIWRYHPTRKVVEAVCHGTTNPWGLDFDEHGEGFFTNCVIGHLWHMIPGAHYKRMYGMDYNRHAYELIDATSEHLHWAGGNWTDSRGGKGKHSDAGGGHAHVGCLVYQGDNFPAEYHNRVFMCNTHGNRLNIDRIECKGNGYVGKRAPDLMLSDNPWFRGVCVTSGPDGAVYVSDWCDLGECHNHDGTHRSSGRIYRAVHGKPHVRRSFDLRKKDDLELCQMLTHSNEWFSRRARLLLAERAAAGKPTGDMHRLALKIFTDASGVEHKLRGLWALYATGGAPPAWLLSQTSHKEEHVRAWALSLLSESSPEGLADALEKAAADPSGLVRLAAASGLERLAHRDRLRVAARLASHAEDAGDRCQPLLIWYGIESAVAAHPEEGVKLALQTKMPKLRQFIARRLSDGGRAASLEPIVRGLEGAVPVEAQRDLLQGMRDGLKGIRKVDVPAGWKTAYADLAKSSSRDIRQLAALLAVQFEDRSAIDHLQAQLVEAKADPADRVIALQALVEKGIDIAPQLFKLLDEPGLRGPALRSLAAYKNDDTPKRILHVYPKLTAAEKQDAISTLASRPQYALALLDAVEQKRIPRGDVTPFTARQLLDLKNNVIKDRLEKVWGSLRKSPAEKLALIDRYKKMLTPDVLAKADLPKGRALFNKTCAQCHKLFGEGHSIGPDLTGSDRANLHYVLENSVDPSAVIGSDYRLTNIVTSKGRLVAGIVVEETERALTVQTATERIVLPKDEIEERKQSNVSMMPEGQLEKLSADELRDLVGYLASKTQVPLP